MEQIDSLTVWTTFICVWITIGTFKTMPPSSLGHRMIYSLEKHNYNKHAWLASFVAIFLWSISTQLIFRIHEHATDLAEKKLIAAKENWPGWPMHPLDEELEKLLKLKGFKK
jgi:hypothetical protein